MNWIVEHLAPLMFAGMILFMLIGYPAAFSLAATGLFFGFLGIEFGLIRPDFLGNLTYQLFGIISNDLLLAIPFFTFMGAILERCGLAEDLLDSFGQLFGPVRGGLSYAVIPSHDGRHCCIRHDHTAYTALTCARRPGRSNGPFGR